MVKKPFAFVTAALLLVGAPLLGCSPSSEPQSSGPSFVKRLTCWFQSPGQPLTATVSRTEARVIFPTGAYKEQWNWNADGPPPVVQGAKIMRTDYSWSVRVGDEYYFGFTHYENGSAQSGPFTSLLEDGTLQNFKVVSRRPFQSQNLDGLSVHQMSCGNVAVSITGHTNVEKIFDGHPQTISVTVPAERQGIMGMTYTYKKIPVKYTN